MILEVAKALGFEPIQEDHLVAWIQCPWCGGRMSLALTWDRCVCHDCEQCGSWEFLFDGFDFQIDRPERLRAWEQLKEQLQQKQHPAHVK